MDSIVRAILVLLAMQLHQTIAGTQSVVVQVGGKTIDIPAPAGFHEISELSPETMRLVEKAVPPDNRLLAAFVSEGDLERIMKGEVPEYRRYMMVQVFRKFEQMTISGSQFAQFADKARREQGTLSEESKAKTQRLVNQAGREILEGYDLAADIRIGEPVSLGVFVDKSDTIAYATLTKYQVATEESKQDVVLASAGCFVNVKSKILYLYIFGRYDDSKDLEWVRTTSGQWADQILRANPGATTTSSPPIVNGVVSVTEEGSIHLNWGVIVISFLLTWGIGLVPPLVIRFLLLRRPMSSRWSAAGVAFTLLILNIAIFTELGSTSKYHSALYLVMLTSYYILRRGAANWAASALQSQPVKAMARCVKCGLSVADHFLICPGCGSELAGDQKDVVRATAEPAKSMSQPDDNSHSTSPADACSTAEQLQRSDEASRPAVSSSASTTNRLIRWYWYSANIGGSGLALFLCLSSLAKEMDEFARSQGPAIPVVMTIGTAFCIGWFCAGINAASTIHRQRARRSTAFVVLLNLPLLGLGLFLAAVSIRMALTGGGFLSSAVLCCLSMLFLSTSVTNVLRNHALRKLAKAVALTSETEAEPTHSQVEDGPMEEESGLVPKRDVKPESRSTTEKGRLSWAIIGGSTVVVAGALAFAFFVWPTVYRYDTMSFSPSTRLPVRMNRLTGETEILYKTGWKEVTDGSPVPKGVALPADELRKLTGTAGIRGEYFDGDIYNGSSYSVYEITLALTVTDSTGTIVLSRLYQLPYTYEGDKPLKPLHSGSFFHSVGFTLATGQKLSWHIAEAKGQPGTE